MRRIKLKPQKDKKVFKNTASRGKKVNLGNITYRGGIRF